MMPSSNVPGEDDDDDDQHQSSLSNVLPAGELHYDDVLLERRRAAGPSHQTVGESKEQRDGAVLVVRASAAAALQPNSATRIMGTPIPVESAVRGVSERQPPSSSGGPPSIATTARSSSSSASHPPIEPGDSGTLRITMPNPEDILLGRGKPIQEHPGNEAMRELVEHHKDRYNNLPRHERGVVANELMGQLRASGARFLKRSDVTSRKRDSWEIAKNSEAYEKLCHALRAKTRRSFSLNRPSPASLAQFSEKEGALLRQEAEKANQRTEASHRQSNPGENRIEHVSSRRTSVLSASAPLDAALDSADASHSLLRERPAASGHERRSTLSSVAATVASTEDRRRRETNEDDKLAIQMALDKYLGVTSQMKQETESEDEE